MSRQELVLLINPAAGGGRALRLLPEVERRLAERELPYRSVLTRDLEHARSEAIATAASGGTVAVMSGDGLVGQVGGVLAQTEGTLGVIPAGRGNDFARVAGIPTEVGRAVETIASGEVRRIDVGEVNGARYLCIASFGFDSDANQIANEARFVRGNLVYLYAALRALAQWRPATFTIEFDGRSRTVRGYSVGACNGKAYGGGMYAAPDAQLDDGLLDVVSCGHMGKLRFLFNLLPKVFKGTHVELPEVTVDRAAQVRVDADRPFAIYADGDHVADLPATITVLPRALRVIVPATA